MNGFCKISLINWCHFSINIHALLRKKFKMIMIDSSFLVYFVIMILFV